MAVSASDIVLYGSAVMAENDATSSVGGAISLTTLVQTEALISPADGVQVVSDDAGDTTQTVTVYGYLANGEPTSQVETLNGTTPVDFTDNDFAFITKVVLNSAADGEVTVQEYNSGSGGDTLLILPAGILQWRSVFINASAEASGGSSRSHYEKVFYKNTGSTSSLLSPAVSLTDGSGNIAFGLESALDGTATTTNRITAPGSITFATTAANLPDHLGPGEAIGIWLRLTLAAGTTPASASFTLSINGTTH